MSAIAIIPARGGSKRIPRKNIADIEGRPMLSYPVEAALGAGIFDEIIVSTEDTEIKSIAEKYGARVIDRPADMATDTAMEIEVYKQVLENLNTRPDYICALYPTAIFVNADDLKGGLEAITGDGKPDAVMSVSRYPIHPFKALESDSEGFLQMVYPTECLQRSQTYPHYVASNGTFYWLRTDAYLKNLTYYPDRLRGYEIPAERAVDIDEPSDLDLARALMRIKRGGA